ncbi:MAG: copper homeostasis protein CutC [Rhizobiales bacterium]|nr:copper homeostasis protein CutC [Hyphomicrobiales bacterium]NRB13222.1 copper homeostasis protein CutC [Hyphomicrobiales bacterium]
MSVLLEICVDSIEGVNSAANNGADRIELCSSLSAGGLTPSAGLIHYVAKMDIPAYAMIRPQDGHFCFDEAEMDIMKRDIDFCRESGLAGVVIGVTHENGTLHYNKLKQLVEHADGMGVTLHRAFDVTPDPLEALELAIEVGVNRILTSGQQESVIDGLALIETLVEKVKAKNSSLSIMPGAGITDENVAQVLAISGITEVHAACQSVSAAYYTNNAPSMAEDAAFSRLFTDPQLVSKLVKNVAKG